MAVINILEDYNMKAITILKVDYSSSVMGVGYDAFTQELFVKFSSGVIYKYIDVEESTYNEILKLVNVGNLSLKSPLGKYVQDWIKGNFEFEKVIQPSDEYEFIAGE
jgi:hypothetical protein